MRKLPLLVLVALLSGPAAAQPVTGHAVGIDGDSLEVGGLRVRLFGIDAPEATQTCERGGQPWQCGQEAASLLQQLLGRGAVSCEHIDTDAYGRSVSSCSVGRIDLADAMVRAGLAVPLTDFSDSYAAAADTARRHNLGIWGGTFEQPADYRASHPSRRLETATFIEPREVARSAPRVAAFASQIPASAVFYRNCAAARAAGAAPLRRGDPGYRPQMDGDNDGVACEPYSGR